MLTHVNIISRTNVFRRLNTLRVLRAYSHAYIAIFSAALRVSLPGGKHACGVYCVSLCATRLPPVLPAHLPAPVVLRASDAGALSKCCGAFYDHE